MQGKYMENTESGHEKASDASSSTQYGFSPFYPSNYPENHSVFVDYLNDEYASSPIGETDDALRSYFIHIHQQDLLDRYQILYSQLCIIAKQAQDLYQENVNLKMINLELNNRLAAFLNATPFHGFESGPGVDAMAAFTRKCLVAEEGISEEETTGKSAVNFVDSALTRSGILQRSHLPKSISVRSSGYHKAIRSHGGSLPTESSVKAPNKGKFIGEAQKVYVKGKKEQPLELEVYNQGMFKTELCNKWQQTGTCPYGNNCQFAHGIRELRPILRHPRYKTEVCRMILDGIPCPYGHRCHFRHSLTAQENLSRAIGVNTYD